VSCESIDIQEKKKFLADTVTGTAAIVMGGAPGVVWCTKIYNMILQHDISSKKNADNYYAYILKMC
jgi:hypothetical protein